MAAIEQPAAKRTLSLMKLRIASSRRCTDFDHPG
jgi:hypothetical protein